MLPLRSLFPMADAIAAAVLLLVSAVLPFVCAPRRRTRLDEDTLPDWRRRDLGLLDGRPPRGGAGLRRHRSSL